ncbi:hypothetical protein NUU61_000595 [Penicillium alfredii]|uniref:SH3b domain-containing protein n=1 Tax=Penicillium alfredii TaxID=1506179 RepID=A0A9W9G9Y7_9EURO|nr:uncharacterized protein NUU61_000595 [Penicillium alfredii]KAJ5114836.1 hypothetical protein NUU61_000595 [Penicillium alfredii]
MVYIPFVALSFAAVAPLVSAYPITGDEVHCRSGPGTNHEVVKSYKKGEDIKVTCQASGTDVKGDELWDKTSDGCYVADYYVKTGTTDAVTETCKGGSGGDDDGNDGGSSGGKLPGLSSKQSSHAREIIGVAKKEDLGHRGCTVGITTALVESEIKVYANSKVPASLNYPHDDVSADYDSVGIFQQRVSIYKDLAADMDPAKSAAQFFKKMAGVDGWKSMSVGKLCQTVQGSAYPSRYEKRVDEAEKICKAGGL